METRRKATGVGVHEPETEPSNHPKKAEQGNEDRAVLQAIERVRSE